jgi:hypothetical protein
MRPLEKLSLVALAIVASCTVPPEPAPTIIVDANVGRKEYVPDAFLTLGDVDTLFAQASIYRPWNPQLLCDSETNPACFTFTSSDESVATVSPNGVITTRSAGKTLLRATYKDLVSGPVTLSVFPRATQLRVSPETIDAAIGDSLIISVTAVDGSGASVAGVLFRIDPTPSEWVVTTVPREGIWRLETPAVLHVLANQAGTVRLTTRTLDEHPESQLVSAPVVVTVRSP